MSTLDYCNSLLEGYPSNRSTKYKTELVHIYVPSRPLMLFRLLITEPFKPPPSRENSMVVGPSVFLLHKPGIVSLTSSAIALLSLPSRLISKLIFSNNILISDSSLQCSAHHGVCVGVCVVW